MTLRDRLLAELANAPGAPTGGSRNGLGNVLLHRMSDAEIVWTAKAEVERRLKVAAQYEKDAIQQRDEAARISAAIARVTAAGDPGEDTSDAGAAVPAGESTVR